MHYTSPLSLCFFESGLRKLTVANRRSRLAFHINNFKSQQRLLSEIQWQLQVDPNAKDVVWVLMVYFVVAASGDLDPGD